MFKIKKKPEICLNSISEKSKSTKPHFPMQKSPPDYRCQSQILPRSKLARSLVRFRDGYQPSDRFDALDPTDQIHREKAISLHSLLV